MLSAKPRTKIVASHLSMLLAMMAVSHSEIAGAGLYIGVVSGYDGGAPTPPPTLDPV